MHSKDIGGVFSSLGSGMDGITSLEAERRLLHDGRNEIETKKPISPIRIFLSQFKSFMIYILLGATLLSLLVKEYVDSIVILVILIFIAVLGFIQEYKAEKSIEALKRLASLKAKVIRNGKELLIDAAEVVKGDLIILETGDKVPADSRLVEVVNLEIDESMLTGESVPVRKMIDALPKDTALADRKNMAYSGSIVTKGRGKAVVGMTGMATEIGKIANLIQTQVDGDTPLQKKLDRLSTYLGVAVIAICVIVLGIGIANSPNLIEHLRIFDAGNMSWWIALMEGMKELLMTAVALGVAAIPEGLPAVVTISLAIGVQRMISKNALIRKLPSVETLGATTVICTDKTGTLTCNEMTVKRIFANGKDYDVNGEGYSLDGGFRLRGRKADPKEFIVLLNMGLLNNDSRLEDGKGIGDPTEVSLLVSAAKAGLSKDDLDGKYPRIHEIGFDSIRKRMSTVHKVGRETLMYTKGAPDMILELCTTIYDGGKVRPLSKADRKRIIQAYEGYSEEALRVLAFALKKVKREDYAEEELTFVGLQAMADPPRKEVRESIEKCRTAGIKVVMITGDYIKTAEAVGKEIGLTGKSILGKDLDSIADLPSVIEEYSIFARVNPEHKMRIIDAFQKRGHIVAMTGDGVNDAPALKKADIGVAMGQSGTDVAKEASDMVVLDDNFTSIVNAVEQGRGIDDNIRKFVNYLISSNLGEVLVIFVAMMIGFRYDGVIVMPLIAVQLLWMNLITDGFPAMALGVDPIDPNAMKRTPRKPKSPIISKNMALNIMVVGVLICFFSLSLFKYGLGESLEKGRTMVFTSLVVFEIVRVYMIRAKYNVGIFENKYLIGAISISLLLQAFVIYMPYLDRIFQTVPLNVMDWAMILGSAGLMILIVTVANLVIQRVTNEPD